MILRNDVPNRHVSAFLEFLENANKKAIVTVQAKHACKSHTASAEKSPDLLLSNAWFGYW